MSKVKADNKKGSILVTILVLMTFLTLMIMSVMILTSANLGRARVRLLQLQSQYSAESGADVAIAMLNDMSDPNAELYSGSAGEVEVLSNNQYRSTFSTSVQTGSNLKERIITSTGRVYSPANATVPSHSRTIRVIAQRSAGTTASAMLSRTIIDVASGVKSIYAKEVYVNDYIEMQKNVNILVAEHITVASKDATAQRCSITGDGNLQKPDVFTLPGYTKVKLDLAYNNCIEPGNVGNADFEVNDNDPSISPVQSMRIPWSQYMDSSYQSAAAGNCSDWTSGGSVRQIPNFGFDKMTHYPDSQSNISTNCGANGDIDLGDNITYVLNDTAHVRANFCANRECNPIFNNPDPTEIKFIFIEGTVNFGSIRSTPGSGPIVVMTYGADPASKVKVCPHGGSLYLGKTNVETKAPAVYLLATYGLCVNQTKFATDSESLGGLAGKSIFVSSNSGVPWSLRLDPSFPASQIPIDLSWRQVGYQRL